MKTILNVIGKWAVLFSNVAVVAVSTLYTADWCIMVFKLHIEQIHEKLSNKDQLWLDWCNGLLQKYVNDRWNELELAKW